MSGTSRHLNAEELLGVVVRDRGGRAVGHIEEMRVERRNGQYLVLAFLLGRGALRRRLAIARRFAGRRETIVVRWNQIDLSRPGRPVLTCPASELESED
ncbi:MAG TPA: hypothetical protein VFV78_07735 [Vicinamibacterales bacterium]|nr:hypothetical protein [Vicinamibacterales bacterium]